MAAPDVSAITDFDGTLARLVLDWAALRRRLGVSQVSELWRRPDGAGWGTVTTWEIQAASTADPVSTVVERLVAEGRFAVLTNNSRRAVSAFLERFPDLTARCVHISGREDLGGPKEEPERFAAGLEAARVALAPTDPFGVTYLGDQDYELVLAASLGCRPLRVTPEGAIHPVALPPRTPRPARPEIGG
jgi:hypothetical protein